MRVNERVFHVRRTLELSQEVFGEKIGLTKSGISNIEKGNRSVTERHIKLIGSQFNVNEEWLRTGQGEMFIQPKEDIWDEYARQHGMTDIESRVLKAYMSVDLHIRKSMMEQLMIALSEQSSSRETIEAKVRSYRAELIAEKNAEYSVTPISNEGKGTA